MPIYSIWLFEYLGLLLDLPVFFTPSMTSVTRVSGMSKLSVGTSLCSEHNVPPNQKDLYAYKFVADSIKNIAEYYDEKGNMLRSTFLKSPIKFQYRIHNFLFTVKINFIM